MVSSMRRLSDLAIVCSRLEQCRASAPSSSVGFFRVIALPLISAWVEVFPECRYILKQVIIILW